MTDAVHYFVPNNPAAARTLRQKLIKHQAMYSEFLASGNAEDWADYKHRVGVIRGLQIAIEECAQIEKDMEN